MILEGTNSLTDSSSYSNIPDEEDVELFRELLVAEGHSNAEEEPMWVTSVDTSVKH